MIDQLTADKIERVIENLSAPVKRKSDKYTDLTQVLKDHPLRIFVQRTTRRPVAEFAGGFGFHRPIRPSASYFVGTTFNIDFAEKKEKLVENVNNIKAYFQHKAEMARTAKARSRTTGLDRLRSQITTNE